MVTVSVLLGYYLRFNLTIMRKEWDTHTW